MDIQKSKNDIIRVLLGLNLISLILGIFYLKAWVYFTTLSISIVLIGTYLIINKYSMLFTGIAAANTLAKRLNSSLGNMQR